jgi:hypothetical protein
MRDGGLPFAAVDGFHGGLPRASGIEQGKRTSIAPQERQE